MLIINSTYQNYLTSHRGQDMSFVKHANVDIDFLLEPDPGCIHCIY